MGFLEKNGLVADLGCGSSKIIQDLPEAIAVDMSIEKMRYIRKSNKYLVNADVAALPFKNGVFSCVICSEVVEHIKQNSIFEEISRILQEGGILILGTPDYGRLRWRIIEFFYGLLQPGGYKDKHITKYDNLTLNNILTSQGFKILIKRYICGSELILKTRKTAVL
jgi:SAM-dependent methyltransferase